MRRREFIELILSGAVVTRPSLAVAQVGSKIYRVGVLTPIAAATPDSGFGPFFRALAKHGYVVDRNLLIESRGAMGRVQLFPQLIDELVTNRVEVIFAFGFPAALAAKQRSAGIPVVVAGAGDPVATGLVESLSRPGGNVTGITEIATELSAKRLELLREAVPTIKRVAVLWNSDDLAMTLRYKATEATGRTIGITVIPLGVREPDDFEGAFAAMTRDPPDGILMVTDMLTRLNRKRVYEFAATQRLPAIYEDESFARDGGLMSYGPDREEVIERAAGLIDRILKGSRPADLPLEQPTRFRAAVNLKTATALGLFIPPSLLARADEVIE
jgi:putative tryptophan/tyrosine transport system substrate-binding protein